MIEGKILWIEPGDKVTAAQEAEADVVIRDGRMVKNRFGAIALNRQEEKTLKVAIELVRPDSPGFFWCLRKRGCHGSQWHMVTARMIGWPEEDDDAERVLACTGGGTWVRCDMINRSGHDDGTRYFRATPPAWPEEPATDTASLPVSIYWPLFQHMSQEFGMSLTDSQMADLVIAVDRMRAGWSKGEGAPMCGVWCCEHKDKCRWQGFALHQGLAWGEVPKKFERHRDWRSVHDEECGGRLIQLVPANDQVQELSGGK